MSQDRTVEPRVPGGKVSRRPVLIEPGAQVGIDRNNEFSASGRTRKFSRNAWVSYRPQLPRELRRAD